MDLTIGARVHYAYDEDTPIQVTGTGTIVDVIDADSDDPEYVVAQTGGPDGHFFAYQLEA
jgi:hypothetical protein